MLRGISDAGLWTNADVGNIWAHAGEMGQHDFIRFLISDWPSCTTPNTTGLCLLAAV